MPWPSMPWRWLLDLNRHVHRSFNGWRDLNFSCRAWWAFCISMARTASGLWNGKIGRIVAGSCAVFFGMVVVAYTPYPDCGWAIREGITYVDPIPCPSLSDVISLHVSS